MTQEQLNKAIEKKYPTDVDWMMDVYNITEQGALDSMDKHMMCQEAALFGAELATPKWISVQDRLPEDGQWVIGANTSGVIPVEYKRKKFYRLTDYYMGDAEYITYWQPLPTPPESK